VVGGSTAEINGAGYIIPFATSTPVP